MTGCAPCSRWDCCGSRTSSRVRAVQSSITPQLPTAFLYRSTSFEGLITQTLGPGQRAFLKLFAKAGIELIDNPNEAGFRLYAQDDGINIDLTPTAERFDFMDILEPNAPALMFTFTPLKLTRKDAKALQHEMIALLERYENRNGPEDFLAHVGLTPGEWAGEV
jgi:hypothetical protein